MGNRTLATAIISPPRKRKNITRFRSAAIRDKDFVPENWLPLIRFLQATGLCRDEVYRLQVEDIRKNPDCDTPEVAVKKGRQR
ncbi:MAG: hypothetical protein ACYDER_03165 [Ktedonobacteraceae bacterium]